MRAALEEGFSWQGVHEQIASDRRRMPALVSGLRPTTPNQYTMRDGRVFDAEAGLYAARWLAIPPQATGGIIPQMSG